MEVSLDLAPILGPTLVRLDSMTIKQLQDTRLYEAIDEFGRLSAASMQVRQPLTSCDKLANSDHTLYLLWEPSNGSNRSRLIGMLKVGRKQLFLYDKELKTYEGELPAVLDFYVHVSCQRQGHGKKLFDYMLQNEKVAPYEIALDSPSVTLLGFMAKNYGLTAPVWQNTNFVVFPQLFHSLSASEESVPEGWSRAAPRHIGRSATDGEMQARTSRGNSISLEGESSANRTLANRSNQARAHKAVILSSKPLW